MSSGELMTSDWKDLADWNVATMDASPARTWTTVPAACGELNRTSRVAWSSPLSGASAIPAEPAATTSAPDTANEPFTSRAPLPLSSGPLTTTVPPLTLASPLESKPSPPASISSVPPVMVTNQPSTAASIPPPRHRAAGAAAAGGGRRAAVASHVEAVVLRCHVDEPAADDDPGALEALVGARDIDGATGDLQDGVGVDPVVARGDRERAAGHQGGDRRVDGIGLRGDRDVAAGDQDVAQRGVLGAVGLEGIAPGDDGQRTRRARPGSPRPGCRRRVRSR